MTAYSLLLAGVKHSPHSAIDLVSTLVGMNALLHHLLENSLDLVSTLVGMNALLHHLLENSLSVL